MKRSIFSSITILTFLSCLLFVNISQAQQSNSKTSFKATDKNELFANLDAPPNTTADKTLNSEAGWKSAKFKNLGAYVKANLTYPEIAKENGVEGNVTILFEISPEGNVIEAKVIKSLGLGCDEAALELIKNMPHWSPASNHGIPTKEVKKTGFHFSSQIISLPKNETTK